MTQWAIVIFIACTLVLFAGLWRMHKKIRRKDTELSIHVHRLEASQKRIRSIIRAIPDFFFIVDWNGKYIEYNGNAENNEELIGKSLSDIHPPEDAKSILDAVRAVLAHGGMKQIEYTLGVPGAVTVHECRIVQLDAGTALCFTRDITKRLEHEEIILHSLHEKEILIREIHHRVRNNMQIISSLLSLQAEHFVNDHDRSIMQDMQYRIQSMARIHEQLYQSENLVSVNLRDYVSGIIDEIVVAVSGGSESIVVTKDIADLEINLDVSMPLGLIVNEVLLSGIKYFQRSGIPEKIGIFLYEEGESVVLDVLHDRSIELGEFFMDERELFSYILVPALTRQLGGTLSMRPGPGVVVRFSFEKDNLCSPGRSYSANISVDNFS